MRTVYLGTSSFAAAVLERLAESAHRPVLVVTRPDKPKGRGRRTSPPPIAATAEALGIELFQPPAVNEPDAVERVAAADPEAVIVCAFGALLKEPLLSRWPMLNVHPSLLPRWRGAAPVERAIMAGDDRTGVAIMRPVAELDAGPVCVVGEEPIRPDDSYGTLAERLQALAGDLLVRALDEQPPFREQPEEGVTYAEKITAEDRTLDPSRPAIDLERTVRALTPHIGTRLALPGGDFLGIRAATAAPGGLEQGRLAEDAGRLLLGCSDGALELHEVQPPGGKAMPASAYLRGHRLE